MLTTQTADAATPILDSGVLPPALPKKRLLGVILGFFFGIAFVIAVSKVSSRNPLPSFTLTLYFASLALVVAIHECGHLLAGWLVGFHFSLISLGPLTLKLEYGQLRVQLRNFSGALGYAGMHIETVRRLRRNLIIYGSAGPLANFVSGGLAATLVASARPAFQHSWTLPLASGFATLSWLVGGLSLVPYGKALRSDGARIRMLLRSRVQTRRWISAAALLSQQRKGIRPKEWKRSWLNAVCAIRDQTADEISGNFLAYIAASDRKDVNGAATHLERCLELAPYSLPTARDFIAREASYFCAWFCNDRVLAEKWYRQAQNTKSSTPLLELRYATAIRAAHGDFDEAMATWKKGEDFVERLPDSLVKKVLQESWQEWGDEIRAKSHTIPEPVTPDFQALNQ